MLLAEQFLIDQTSQILTTFDVIQLVTVVMGGWLLCQEPGRQNKQSGEERKQYFP